MANGNFAGGDGTMESPFLIEDAHDLNAVRNGLALHYKLIKDVDLNIPPFNEGTGWTPITSFTGVLDGDKNIVKNLFINRPTDGYSGLFGTINGGGIKNLGVENVNVTGYSYVGGLVGSAGGTLIDNCYTTGTITGSQPYVGGFMGRNANLSTVSNCHSSCEVRSNGGFVGGFVGGNSTDSGRNLIKNCFSIGKLNIRGQYTGGFAGYVYNSTTTNCFWDTETTGMTTSASGTGKTTAQMKTPQTFIDAGWNNEQLGDGTEIWSLYTNEYPKLWFEKIPRHFILSDGKVFTITNDTLEETGFIESTLTQENFEEKGLVNLFAVTPTILSGLVEPIEILTWTPYDETPIITHNVNQFKVLDLFDNYSILTWTDSTSVTKVALNYLYGKLKTNWIDTTTDLFSPMEKLNQEDNFEILTWTDAETNPKLELTIPQFRHIDKLNNEFKIITGRPKPIQ